MSRGKKLAVIVIVVVVAVVGMSIAYLNGFATGMANTCIERVDDHNILKCGYRAQLQDDLDSGQWQPAH